MSRTATAYLMSCGLPMSEGTSSTVGACPSFQQRDWHASRFEYRRCGIVPSFCFLPHLPSHGSMYRPASFRVTTRLKLGGELWRREAASAAIRAGGMCTPLPCRCLLFDFQPQIQAVWCGHRSLPMKKSSLITKLLSVMKEVDRVPKHGRNEYHGYSYALETDIIAAVRNSLVERGIFISTSVASTGRQGDVTEVTTKHTFHDAETGEELTVRGYGQGQDWGDKGGYKAITGAIKYFLLKNFLIATGDDPEHDIPAPPPQRVQEESKLSNGPSEPTASSAQLKLIAMLAGQVEMDVQKDIYARMGIQDVPTKRQASSIIDRLQELKAQRQKVA